MLSNYFIFEEDRTLAKWSNGCEQNGNHGNIDPHFTFNFIDQVSNMSRVLVANIQKFHYYPWLAKTYVCWGLPGWMDFHVIVFWCCREDRV